MGIPLTDDMFSDEAIPPGTHIAWELKARRWTQAAFADILQQPLPVIKQIIKGEAGVTPETAVALGSAFGTSAEFWMNLESHYRLHPKVRGRVNVKGIKSRAKALEKQLAARLPRNP